MIKKTLYFGNPCYLRKKDLQLVVEYPDETKEAKSRPIEDVALVFLDHPQITITQGLLQALLGNNAAVVSCDASHLPLGMMLNLQGHSQQTEYWRYQLESSVPLKKNLWQQTVQAKIINQAAVLQLLNQPADNLLHWAQEVKSGDPDNYEARAAGYYWKNLLSPAKNFGGRHREGEPPNNLLNFGYAVVRSMVARALVSSGMLPALGIFHRNKYNPYCLADDIMEPYRPFVDLMVLHIVERYDEIDALDKTLKAELLTIPQMDVVINDMRSPMMVGVHRTTASLMECFEGKTRKIRYPRLLPHA